MAKQRKISGRVARDVIRTFEIPRLPKKLLDGFSQLADLTASVSDAMDNLGLAGVIPASVIPPVSLGKRAVGQAVTVRNVERKQSVFRSATERTIRTGAPDAYNMARPGDVIVIEGVLGASNMGGNSATMCHRQGCSGAVIDGSCRDPDASRELGFPIWARGITPMTGKWRLETVEINGRVRIAGISVDAGDLVVADCAGVAFVPREHAAAVLAECRKIDEKDKKTRKAIAAGVDILSIVQRKF